jgi:sec-independent protein translocase protein TatA
MGALKPWHIIVIVVLLVLLFGAKRLPDAARSLGRSLRIMKAETKGLIDDDNDVAEKAEPQYGRQPLHPSEIQHPGQQPPPAYQQPTGQPQYQQPQYQQPQYQPQPPPPAQPYVDPVQRSNER